MGPVAAGSFLVRKIATEPFERTKGRAVPGTFERRGARRSQQDIDGRRRWGGKGRGLEYRYV